VVKTPQELEQQGPRTGLRSVLVIAFLAATIGAQVAQAQTLTVLHSFQGSPDGATPEAPLLLGGDGNIYGTTLVGGAYHLGSVFRIDRTGTETILYSFAGGSDGALPYSGVILDQAGNIYGTTYNGGSTGGNSCGCGTVFKVDAVGNETILYRFTGGSDGFYPYGGLVSDASGQLYGTAIYDSGVDGCGVVFKLDPDTGRQTVLHSFNGPDGCKPYGTLVMDKAGALYGTTYTGGPKGK
jgi:uncharacterized repeat protein (TIGR03803 family)